MSDFRFRRVGEKLSVHDTNPPYADFAVERIAKAWRVSEEGVVRHMVLSWITDHYATAVDAGASIADFKQRPSGEDK